jgi:hypothetical protein
MNVWCQEGVDGVLGHLRRPRTSRRVPAEAEGIAKLARSPGVHTRDDSRVSNLERAREGFQE